MRATVGGFVMSLLSSHPIFSVLIPLAMLYGRGIENISDSQTKCKFLCQSLAEYHNKELILEMKNYNSLLEEVAVALGFPIDEMDQISFVDLIKQIPLVCVEERLSLLQRYKLKSVVKNVEAQSRIQHFNKFIEKFADCDADPEAVYEEALKLAEKIKVRN